MDPAQFIQSFISALKNQEVRDSLGDIVAANVKNEITQLREELKTKDAKIDKLERRIESLESDVDSLEQYSRRNSIRLFGLEEKPDEDAASLAVSFVNEHMKVEPPITVDDIDRVHRVGKKIGPTESESSSPQQPKPRAILMKFATYRARQRVVTQRKHIKDTGYYMNEDLTRARSTMLYKARVMKRQKLIQESWTHDGAFVIKDNHNKIHSARSLQQCDELLKSFVRT